MNAALLALYKALVSSSPVMYSVRGGKAKAVLGLYATREEADAAATKGQVVAVFEPSEEEGQLIDLVCPPVQTRVDPMVNRLKKSEVERPVQFVLRVVRENPQLDRKGLIALCISLGVADYTARTQVQVGLKRRKAVAELAAAVAAQAEADAADAEGAAGETEQQDSTEVNEE